MIAIEVGGGGVGAAAPMGGAGGNAVPTAPHVPIAVHRSEYALWYAAHVDMPEKAGRLSLTAGHVPASAADPL
jgi:hypothetical protein